MNALKIFILWLILFIILIRKRRSDRWIRRRWRTHPVNRDRMVHGHYVTVFQRYKLYSEKFYQYLRMDLKCFNFLLSLLEKKIKKTHPNALCPEFRLVVTLRYLISGNQLQSIAENFMIGYSTLRIIIVEVSELIVRILQPIYLRIPTKDEWEYIAADFLSQWNIPNCVGAIDGKHVSIVAPDNAGTLFYNYKKRFSIVLFAACDANYIFTTVHIGEMGSISDAAIFADTELGHQLRENLLNLPKGTARLPGSDLRAPCYFIGDDAFPLLKNLMKPFTGRNLMHYEKIFNYRISRARRVIESAFGILRSRFRILKSEISIQPENASTVVAACVCLHNFISITRKEDSKIDFQVHFNENETGIESRGPVGIRNNLAGYFLTEEGQVPWQESAINCSHNLIDYE